MTVTFNFTEYLRAARSLHIIPLPLDMTLFSVYIGGKATKEMAMGLVQYSDNGFFAPRKIAEAFRTTSEEVARTAGLGKDAVQRKDRVRSDKTQKRLREMIEIINKTEPRFGSGLMAYAWFRSEPLAGFSGQTAMQLVRNGRAEEVLDYIDAVDAGVHV